MLFYKYQGAGNDFIMIDQRRQQWLRRTDTEQIELLCDRHFGIGADGLILLQEHTDYDFEMVYFNSDGRESTMCGNGGRCIAAFAHHLSIPSQENGYLFWAIDGGHRAVLPYATGPGGEWVELKMTDVGQVEALTGGTDFVLNTGSPHFVRFVPDPEQLNVPEEGRGIRNSDRFKQEGINVNFVGETENGLCIRTYERGVEDETLACGTGVTAAAIAAWLQKGGRPGPAEFPVQARGGKLKVRFTAQANGAFYDIWLCGPAQQVFKGEIDV